MIAKLINCSGCVEFEHPVHSVPDHINIPVFERFEWSPEYSRTVPRFGHRIFDLALKISTDDVLYYVEKGATFIVPRQTM